MVLFQTNLRGRRAGAVPAVQLSVLRGERGRKLRRGFPRLPVAAAGGQVGPAAQGVAHQTEAGRQQCVESFRQHLRQELEGRPEETALVKHLI